MKKAKNKLIYKVLASFIAVALMVTAIPVAYRSVHAESNVKNIAPDAAIEAETPDWVENMDWMKYPMLVNGSTTDNGFYTSEFASEKDTAKTITFSYGERAAYVEKLVLHPRVENGTSYGFPADYRVTVWDGKDWVEVKRSVGNVNVTAPVEVVVDKTCNSIIIMADVLGPSGNLKEPYCLQLTEIEIMGSYVSGTLLPPDSELSGLDNIAPNATIEAETPWWIINAERWDLCPDVLKDGFTDADHGFYTSDEASDANTNKTIEFKFSADYNMTGVVLYPRDQNHHNGFPEEFKIEIYDGNTWKEVATGGSVADANGWVSKPEMVSFEPTCGSRLKITATKLGYYDDTAKYGLQLAEVAIFGTANIAPKATIEAETPWWIISAGRWELCPDVLKDGFTDADHGFYTSDEASDANTNKTIEFKFSADYNMTGVVLYPRDQNHHNGFPEEFKIEIYDGNTWKEVATGGSVADANGWVSKPEMVSFEPTCGSRLKITATKLGYYDDTAKYGLQLAEVDIFGTEVPASEVYYNLDTQGDYRVFGKILAKDGKVYENEDYIIVSGDYTASSVVNKKAVVQKIYIWKTGDTHPDNNLDVRDLVALKKAALGQTLTTKSGMKACDMNGDGAYNDADVAVLRRKILSESKPTPLTI